MSKYIYCGSLFTGRDQDVKKEQLIVVEGDEISFVGASSDAPVPKQSDEVINHSQEFVLPGLIDIHVHLAYGNAKTEEDIDLFSSVEFRTLRGMEAAQRVLLAGFTSIADPATTGSVSPAIRDAVSAGLFVGPRVTTSGRQITNRQGLSDFYPSWIGVPKTSVGVLATNLEEGIAQIRLQVKDGVDFIKIAMDGDSMNPSTNTLVSGYTQDETTGMVAEAHRLGKKVVVHARGAEAVLYSAKAGVDVILHASWISDEGIEWVIKNGCTLCPTLSLLINNIEFTQPTDGCYPDFPDAHKRELEALSESLPKAREAGVPFMSGSDAGFAVTPYGEWHARELEYYVKYLGFSPVETLRIATFENGKFLRNAGKVGAIEVGRIADILAFDGNPLNDISALQDRTRISAIYLGGELVKSTLNPDAHRLSSEFSYNMWSEVYTQARVDEIRNSRRKVAG